MNIIKKFRKSEKGSITVMVLSAMLFLIGTITVSYFAMSNKSIDQDKKVSQIAKQYKASDEDMEKEYQKAVNNLKVEDYVKVGDYVDYNPTIASKDGTKVEESKLSYTSPTGTASEHGNGYSEQTFKATENTQWRVLSIENGTVELISRNGIKTFDKDLDFFIKGARGYLYAEQELNEVCKIFGYGYGADTTKGGSYTVGGPLDTLVTGKIEGTGARSITVEDINAITGYNPTTAKYGEGNSYEYGNKVTYTRGEGTQNTFNYYDKTNKTFKALTSGSTEITSTYYYYYAGEFGKNNGTDGTSAVDDIYNLNETYKMLFGYDKVGSDNGFRNFTNGKCEQKYWLASDYAYAEPYFVKWGLRYVNDGYVNRNYLCDSGGYESSYSSYGVRPVVSLKSDVSLEWNETAKEWKIK